MKGGLEGCMGKGRGKEVWDVGPGAAGKTGGSGWGKGAVWGGDGWACDKGFTGTKGVGKDTGATGWPYVVGPPWEACTA